MQSAGAQRNVMARRIIPNRAQYACALKFSSDVKFVAIGLGKYNSTNGEPNRMSPNDQVITG